MEGSLYKSGGLPKRCLQTTTSTENSFEHNQSYPALQKTCKRSSFGICAKGVENLTGEEYDSYSYNKEACNQQYQQKMASIMNSSLGSSSGAREDLNLSHSKENRRALFTVSADDWKVLTMNKLALELCGTSATELVGKDLRTLWSTSEHKNLTDDSLETSYQDSDILEPSSGKIVDLKHRKGFHISVSIWHKIVDEPSGISCRIVVIEPVERISCLFDFNEQGQVIYCDEKFAGYHGLQASDLEFLNLNKVMPSYKLPSPTGSSISKEIRLQYTTSTFSDGSNFPVTILITSQHKTKKLHGVPRCIIFKAKMWIFPHISGVITCKSSGEIQSVNDNLSRHLFGYSSKELRAVSILDLVPNVLDQEVNDGLYSSVVPQIEMDSSLNFSCQEDANMKTKMDHDSTIESWVEVSLLSNDNVDKSANSENGRTNGSTQNHSDFLNKINALLNHSSDSPTKNDQNQVRKSQSLSSKCKEASTNSDSAIHSICSSYKCTIPTSQYSLSDYHSADGLENQPLASGPDHRGRETRSRTTSSLDQSSYVILDDETETDGFDQKDEKKSSNPTFYEKDAHVLSRLKRISEVTSTSTPIEQARALSRISGQDKTLKHLQPGFCKGKFKHKHGALIDFSYELNKVNITNSQDQMLYFRVYAQTAVIHNLSLEAFNSTIMSTASTLPSLCVSMRSLHDVASFNSSHAELEPFEEHIEKCAAAGEFSNKYSLVKQIGSGAFGFVQIAKCKRSSKEFVVKFIKKEKILDECWVHDDELECLVPMEISFLSKFKHPNIIQIVDFFENKNFFSVVMPKHGTHAIDLFEFIDRSNNGVDRSIGEPLSSYIFRQIVSAVSYLHERCILHRDIKDENVIIDESFNCKLIDFGSATFMRAGKKFSTFCGTLEYCSPEVLMGNKYEGPELEMWSLGVTLYTIVFGENPFRDVDETIACEVDPPFGVTRDLATILQWLLHPAPEYRCTMQDLLESEWLNQKVDINNYHWDDIFITPAGSLNSSYSRVEQDFNDHPLLDEENLCYQLEKLTVAASKHAKTKRDVLKPVNNLNKTV